MGSPLKMGERTTRPLADLMSLNARGGTAAVGQATTLSMVLVSVLPKSMSTVAISMGLVFPEACWPIQLAAKMTATMPATTDRIIMSVPRLSFILVFFLIG
jgi:hypothetical protein